VKEGDAVDYSTRAQALASRSRSRIGSSGVRR
jgi:hypothetical protein